MLATKSGRGPKELDGCETWEELSLYKIRSSVGAAAGGPSTGGLQLAQEPQLGAVRERGPQQSTVRERGSQQSTVRERGPQQNTVQGLGPRRSTVRGRKSVW